MTIRLLDVTLREAGLVNGYAFTARQAAAIAAVLDRAGVDTIELGYRRPAGAGATGAACPPEYIAQIREACVRAELGVMIHPSDVELDEYARLRDQGIALVRFAVAARELPALAGHARAAHAAGLRFTVNLTRATEVPADAVIEAARAAEDAGAACFYIADSNGSLYPERAQVLTSRLREATRLALGFHAHDNLRLAFANTLIALRNGFSWIDASLGGAGKGGGNLILELIAGHLGVHGARRFDVFAMARAYAEHVAPTMPAEHRSCTTVFGLLDYNLDRIAELSREAERRGVPLESIVADLYDLRTRSAPATPDMSSAPPEEERIVS
jgi:4-hydroxy 2-oxovalerate aldolase